MFPYKPSDNLAVEPCVMRKGFNGLSIAAVEHLAQPLACDALFVFINKETG